MFNQRTNKVDLAVFSAITLHTNVHTLVCNFENGFSYRFEPQLVQNMSSVAILEPHLTQKPDSGSFFFLGFLVFLVVFLAVFLVFLAAFFCLAGFFFAISPTSPSSVIAKPSAPAFIPDLLRYCLSYSSSSCWRDFLPVPVCTCIGFAADGSGSDTYEVGGELGPAFFAPQLVQNASSAPICEPQLEQEPDPVCISPGLGRRGSGLRSLSR